MGALSLFTDVIARKPDFIIERGGRPYLTRWHLLRGDAQNVYLHHITQNDLDAALHDHPWNNVSVLLKGGYDEITSAGLRCRFEGDVVFRRAEELHRIVLPPGQADAWTLFITGPKVRDWGFACPKGWVPWQQFVDPLDTGKIGKGCAQ